MSINFKSVKANIDHNLRPHISGTNELSDDGKILRPYITRIEFGIVCNSIDRESALNEMLEIAKSAINNLAEEIKND